MRLSNRVVSVGLCIATSIGVSVNVAGPSLAATRSVTVTPNIGLRNGDIVTATGTGYTPSVSAVAIQCASVVPLTQNDCDLDTVHFLFTDATGTVVANFQVKTTLTIANGGSFDCAAAPSACKVAIAEASDYVGLNAATAISFSPIGPPQRGHVAVTPTSFTDFGIAQLDLTGWAAYSSLIVGQCPYPTSVFDQLNCSQIDDVHADVNGTASATMQTYEDLLGLRCAAAPGACSVFVADSRAQSNTFVNVPMTFVQATAGTISVNPSVGLMHRGTVTVAGAGWAPGRVISIDQCMIDCATYQTTIGDAETTNDGTFAVNVTAVRFEYDSPICGVPGASCSIVVRDEFGPALEAGTPVSFTPLGAAIRGSVASPATVPAGEISTIDASGWAPEVPITIGMCATGDYRRTHCDVSSIEFDATGSIDDYSFWPHEALGSADCTVAGNCEFVAWDPRDQAGTIVVNALQITVPSPGTLNVTPTTGLMLGNVFGINGSGWSRSDPFAYIGLCATAYPCNHSQYTEDVVVAGDGTFDLLMDVDDTAHNSSNGWPVDCSVAPGTCALVVWQYAGSRRVIASVPLTYVSPMNNVDSHYTAAEYAAVQAGAAELGVSVEEFQHIGPWFISWLVSFGRVPAPPATDAGPSIIRTSYASFELPHLNSFATSQNMTLPEYQKSGAVSLAYLLSLN